MTKVNSPASCPIHTDIFTPLSPHFLYLLLCVLVVVFYLFCLFLLYFYQSVLPSIIPSLQHINSVLHWNAWLNVLDQDKCVYKQLHLDASTPFLFDSTFLIPPHGIPTFIQAVCIWISYMLWLPTTFLLLHTSRLQFPAHPPVIGTHWRTH